MIPHEGGGEGRGGEGRGGGSIIYLSWCHSPENIPSNDPGHVTLASHSPSLPAH